MYSRMSRAQLDHMVARPRERRYELRWHDIVHLHLLCRQEGPGSTGLLQSRRERKLGGVFLVLDTSVRPFTSIFKRTHGNEAHI